MAGGFAKNADDLRTDPLGHGTVVEVIHRFERAASGSSACIGACASSVHSTHREDDESSTRYDARMSDAVSRLEHLRARRARRAPQWAIDGLISAIEKDGRKRQRSLGDLIELWERLLPPELARQTKLQAFRAGVLMVIVETSAARFELDRALRGGLEAALRQAFSASLVRVKVVLGAFE
jgi:hypothetical protein